MHSQSHPWVQAPEPMEASDEVDAPSSFDLALTALLCVALVAVVAAVATWLMRADATDLPPAAVTPVQWSSRSHAAHEPHAFVSPIEGRLDPALPRVRADIERFALNYLLLPLIDDTEPMRWADPSIGLTCGGDSQVLVDGRPLEVGALLPARDFAMQFVLRGCSPAAEEAMAFHGAVDMLVRHASGQLTALVQPRHLTVLTAQGRTSLASPFTACLAVDRASTCEQQPTVTAARTGF